MIELNHDGYIISSNVNVNKGESLNRILIRLLKHLSLKACL